MHGEEVEYQTRFWRLGGDECTQEISFCTNGILMRFGSLSRERGRKGSIADLSFNKSSSGQEVTMQ